MASRRSHLAVVLVGLLSVACDSTPPPARDAGGTTCGPGASEPCACPDGSTGARQCTPAGEWSACGACLSVDAGDAPWCGDSVCNGGESCATCAPDCGACPACGPGNCSGCCDLDACVTGLSTGACGVGGATCSVCPLAFVCSGGSCAVDPVSRWSVVLDSLTVPTLNTAGEAWDVLGGAPDPFVEIRIEREDAAPLTSGAGSDTFSVIYDGGATASDVTAARLLARLDFTVWDQDTTVHDFIGRCVYAPLDQNVFEGGAQVLECAADIATMNAGFTLVWHLERF